MPDTTTPLPLETKIAFKREGMSAGDVERLCRKHFEPPHFAFLTQVRNGTGYSRRQTRTADAIAMGTWPSRGIHLHGIEIKVSHSDFLAELKNPEKAEDMAQYCHFWWLAISHPKVAPINEVPPNWGLLVSSDDGSKLSVVREAVKKEARSPDHLLLAAIMRKVSSEYIHRDELKEWQSATRAALEKSADQSSKFLREGALTAAKNSAELLDRVEKAFGCRITEWNSTDFIETYALAKTLRLQGKPTVHAIKNLVRIVKTFEPELEKVSAVLESREVV